MKSNLTDETFQDFLFTDPRGFHYKCDLGYDIGKICHSIYGLYDWLDMSRFNADIIPKDNDGVHVKYNIIMTQQSKKVTNLGGSGAGVNTEQTIVHFVLNRLKKNFLIIIYIYINY